MYTWDLAHWPGNAASRWQSAQLKIFMSTIPTSTVPVRRPPPQPLVAIARAWCSPPPRRLLAPFSVCDSPQLFPPPPPPVGPVSLYPGISDAHPRCVKRGRNEPRSPLAERCFHSPALPDGRDGGRVGAWRAMSDPRTWKI